MNAGQNDLGSTKETRVESLKKKRLGSQKGNVSVWV